MPKPLARSIFLEVAESACPIASVRLSTEIEKQWIRSSWRWTKFLDEVGTTLAKEIHEAEQNRSTQNLLFAALNKLDSTGV